MTFCVYLVHFVPVLVLCTEKNLATLFSKMTLLAL
jgi:hypothetical protein